MNEQKKEGLPIGRVEPAVVAGALSAGDLAGAAEVLAGRCSPGHSVGLVYDDLERAGLLLDRGHAVHEGGKPTIHGHRLWALYVDPCGRPEERDCQYQKYHDDDCGRAAVNFPAHFPTLAFWPLAAAG